MKNIVKNILITLLFGIVYYYFVLPPLNITDISFWLFVITLLFVYFICSKTILFSNTKIHIIRAKIINKKERNYEYLIPIIIITIVMVISLINLILSPLFLSKVYSKRITVNEDNSFIDDIKEVDFNTLPIIDKDSSRKLGDRVMGHMPELVSQFDVSNLYTQINFNNDIVRVTPLEYSDIFKYFANRKDGIKGYIVVNSVTGESKLIKLDKGLKYAPSAFFFEDLDRKLRFKYPTKIFGQKSFEIDNDGNPYWIIPVIKYHGINIRRKIVEAIIFNPITGESKLYDVKDVPSWVDHVYSAELIIEQVNDWGKYKRGFINSIIGQKGVVATTEGYNYTVMNDDVYLYTGITSAVADESNIGFILTNLRTKETNFYPVAGAEEYSAMASAEGQVQQMKYISTFPLLINLNNKPTYFVSLKDNAGLVKMYGLVDVADYQKVTVVDVSLGLNELVKRYLQNDVIDDSRLLFKDIRIKSITSVVIDNNTYYYIVDTTDQKYSVAIKVNPNKLPFLKVNDEINIGYLKEEEVTEIKVIK